VRKLIQLNVDIDSKTKDKENTALILATMNNQVLIVKYLLENKADSNIRNKEGKRAKDYAYEINNIKLV
jgi:ankyrin repeat protein